MCPPHMESFPVTDRGELKIDTPSTRRTGERWQDHDREIWCMLSNFNCIRQESKRQGLKRTWFMTEALDFNDFLYDMMVEEPYRASRWELNSVEETIESIEATKYLLEQRKITIVRLAEIQAKYDIMLYQKSKVTWIREGDENTCYSHETINLKCHYNNIYIYGLLVDGQWLKEIKEIKQQSESGEYYDSETPNGAKSSKLDIEIHIQWTLVAHPNAMTLYGGRIYVLCSLQAKEILKAIHGKIRIPSDAQKPLAIYGKYRQLSTRVQTDMEVQSTYKESTCSLCQSDKEDVKHLFCLCPLVNQIWRSVTSWLNVPMPLQNIVKEGMI
ncbi:hypothetical protein VNO77_05238 [Canavalia gladiata]|uniref:Reverse transcriptase zinc-binding domain-containing protein n=1 Tax=Canavalia gladiata TaxID=3824 RepID=A0AAN9RDZ3_CANGL